MDAGGRGAAVLAAHRDASVEASPGTVVGGVRRMASGGIHKHGTRPKAALMKREEREKTQLHLPCTCSFSTPRHSRELTHPSLPHLFLLPCSA